MDRPSSSKMMVASFLTSGSMRIVVAGMFDGMVIPFLVYHGAAILSSLCGGCDPVAHVGLLDVEPSVLPRLAMFFLKVMGMSSAFMKL